MKLLFNILMPVLLVACAEQPGKSTVLVPVEERNSPVIGDKTKRDAPSYKAPVKTQTEPVIIALINEATTHSKQGNTEQASASIERALRIEPKNALLWHHLSLIRLQQQQWQQAIVMARKSNALTVNNDQLKSDNWGVIATAYENLGDVKKANEARNKQTGKS